MAKKLFNINKLRKNSAKWQKKMSTQHDELIKGTDQLLDQGFENVNRWQQLVSQSIDKTQPLRKKQIDIIFDALEGVKDQYLTASNRLSELTGIDSEDIKAAKDKGIQWAKDKKSEIEEVVEKNPVLNKISDTVEDVADDIEDAVEDAVENVNETVTKAKKEIADAVKSDLKIIDGIGPKLESSLNELGIMSYQDILNKSDEELKAIFEKLGGRYKSIDPQEWKKQAELAANDKHEALNDYIKSIKS